MMENCKPDFNNRRIWMYWPGENAWLFNENIEKGFMACGINGDREVGDLNEVMRKPGGLEAALKEAYMGGNIFGGKKLLEEFANMMKVGDFILARNEFRSIVGLGIVTGDYYFDDSRSLFRHCRKVEWINTEIMPFPNEFKNSGKWKRVTLVDQSYRKVAEEIITCICEDREYDASKSIGVEQTQTAESVCACNYSHTAFMNTARQHQEAIVRKWANELFGGICIWDERPRHAAWLKDEYAAKGLVFYSGFRQEILSMYHSGRTNIGMNLLRNTLRSEHIPYNLFFPMMKSENKEATKSFFNELLGASIIKEILEVKIEYAPQPKQMYLNDGTSFDTFVLFRHNDGTKGAIGIEVKYTEREYSIGEMEYKNTHNEAGQVELAYHYAKATRGSGYYLDECSEMLVTDNLRQIWRNHILGASMVLKGDIKHFLSITIFPEGNPHFHFSSDEYRKLLSQKGHDTFFTFTYEKVFETLRKHFISKEHTAWIDYLYKRYLFDYGSLDNEQINIVDSTVAKDNKDHTRKMANSKLATSSVAVAPSKYNKSFIALFIIAVVEFMIILYLLTF